MKIISNNPKEGDERIIKKFAFFPISIKDNTKTYIRWLVFCTIKQKYYSFISWDDDGIPESGWVDMEFLGD